MEYKIEHFAHSKDKHYFMKFVSFICVYISIFITVGHIQKRLEVCFVRPDILLNGRRELIPSFKACLV